MMHWTPIFCIGVVTVTPLHAIQLEVILQLTHAIHKTHAVK